MAEQKGVSDKNKAESALLLSIMGILPESEGQRVGMSHQFELPGRAAGKAGGDRDSGDTQFIKPS